MHARRYKYQKKPADVPCFLNIACTRECILYTVVPISSRKNRVGVYVYIALAVVFSVQFLRSQHRLWLRICSWIYATIRDKAAAPALPALRRCPQRRALGVEVGHSDLRCQSQSML